MKRQDYRILLREVLKAIIKVIMPFFAGAAGGVMSGCTNLGGVGPNVFGFGG